MSQGNFNAPPAKSGGGNTLMIVLVIFAVLGLICVGACGACYYGAQSLVTAVGGGVFAETSMAFIRDDQGVKDELGEPLAQENAKFVTRGNTIVVDFDVKGPRGTGKGHSEFSVADSNAAPGNPPKPGTITVTLPSGKTVNVSTTPRVDFQNEIPEMPDEGGTDPTDSGDVPGTPGDSTEM